MASPRRLQTASACAPEIFALIIVNRKHRLTRLQRIVLEELGGAVGPASHRARIGRHCAQERHHRGEGDADGAGAGGSSVGGVGGRMMPGGPPQARSPHRALPAVSLAIPVAFAVHRAAAEELIFAGDGRDVWERDPDVWERDLPGAVASNCRRLCGDGARRLPVMSGRPRIIPQDNARAPILLPRPI